MPDSLYLPRFLVDRTNGRAYATDSVESVAVAVVIVLSDCG